jgi:hypothetical protein
MSIALRVWFANSECSAFITGPSGKIQSIFLSSIAADEELISPVRLSSIREIKGTDANIVKCTRGMREMEVLGLLGTVVFLRWLESHSVEYKK